MKKLLRITAVFMASLSLGIAQQADKGPINEAPEIEQLPIFDLEFFYDVGSSGAVGADGLAGVVFINNQYWLSEWESELIHILDANGGFVETTVIDGISGTRSFSSDGTNVFIGNDTEEIFVVDPASKLVIDTIPSDNSAFVESRMIAYDPTLDGGDGGFWIGDFSSDIVSIDLGGNELSIIPLDDHGTVIYGGAVDTVTDGGPYLWIHDQSGVEPERDFLTQIDLSTGEQTGLVFDVSTLSGDFGSTNFLAGGLFISDEVTTGNTSLVGLCQCDPSNILFSVTLDEDLGFADNQADALQLVPNPVSGNVVSITSPFQGKKDVVISDVTGKILLTTTTTRDVDISSLSDGMYLVTMSQNDIKVTKRLLVN